MAHYIVISATPIRGKELEAAEGLVELAKHFNANYPAKVEILRSMDEPTNRYHWVYRFESQSAAEEIRAKWREDPKDQEYAAKVHQHWEAAMEERRYAVL